jgi:anti-sigma regulatory factor (Ser/Thr protein kinase)
MIHPTMSPEPLPRHTLTLESGTAASGAASEWARRLAERAGWPEERVYALDLCIVEIVSNVVNHAYRGGAGEIRLELAIGRAGGAIAIIDQGPPFDPLSVPAPVLATSIEDTRIGGYGIHMARSAASACRYERRDGRNVFIASFG